MKQKILLNKLIVEFGPTVLTIYNVLGPFSNFTNVGKTIFFLFLADVPGYLILRTESRRHRVR